MKKALSILSSLCMAAVLLAAAACGVSPKGPNGNDGPALDMGGAKELAGFHGTVTPLSREERASDDFSALQRSAEAFSEKFTEAAGMAYAKSNFAVSPISVYMALSLAAQTSLGETKEELLSALGTDAASLRRDYSALYRSLETEYRTDKYSGEKLVGCVDLSNSVWVDEAVSAKRDCLETLANGFYCNSYSADFAFANAEANRAVRAFVKEQTRGLIDQNFKLSERTVFALINTLYLKDIWNYGADLGFTQRGYAFRNEDGTETNKSFLSGTYRAGRAVETERYTHFRADTANGYRLKFIVPKDGYTARQLCTAEVLSEVNAISSYGAIDEEQGIRYLTRCLFPEFSASYNEDVIGILRQSFGIESLFSPTSCDLTALCDVPAYCTEVRHVTKLNVDKTGIEGAAVTMMQDAMAAPPVYENVYEDFLVDRAFVFLLTDHYDTILFSGVVGKV